MKYRSIIFDFDGVLCHTHGFGLKVLKNLCRGLNIKPDYKGFRKLEGFSNMDKLKILYPDKSKVILKLWNKLYYKDYIGSATIYDGMKEMLHVLSSKNIPLFIYSGRRKKDILQALKKHGIEGRFMKISTDKFTKTQKPTAAGIKKLMKKYHLDSSKTILIGDSGVDRRIAEMAGIKFGLALWGSKNPNAIKNPDAVFRHPKEITNII